MTCRKRIRRCQGTRRASPRPFRRVLSYQALEAVLRRGTVPAEDAGSDQSERPLGRDRAHAAGLRPAPFFDRRRPLPRPVPPPDSNVTAKNSTLSVSAAQGVLANDTDPDVHDQGHLFVSGVNGSAANVGQAVAGSFGAVGGVVGN